MIDDADSRRGHPIADAIGAVARGAREGDRQIQRNAKAWFAWLGGGGLAIYIAVRAWGVAEEGIKRTWTADDRQTRELVTAMKELVVEIRADRAERTRDLDLIMDRLKIPRRPAVVVTTPRPDPFRDPSADLFHEKKGTP
jgi:hypothetical protein